MIAVDTSSFVAFLSGEEGEDVGAVSIALAQKQVVLPPVVLSELLSDPQLPAAVASVVKELPMLGLGEGYWERVGNLRSKILKEGRKARLADALITQSCLDHQIPLITRDRDFQNFARSTTLKLL